MPLIVNGTETAHVASTNTHTVSRITAAHYIVTERRALAGPCEGRWLTSVLPAGEWVTEWDNDQNGRLVVHVTPAAQLAASA